MLSRVGTAHKNKPDRHWGPGAQSIYKLQWVGFWLTIKLFTKEGCRMMNVVGKGNVPNINFGDKG